VIEVAPLPRGLWLAGLHYTGSKVAPPCVTEYWGSFFLLAAHGVSYQRHTIPPYSERQAPLRSGSGVGPKEAPFDAVPAMPWHHL
jgi:hypothetical protein